MANEQEAAAGLYSLLKANPDDGPQARPDPPRSSPSTVERTNGSDEEAKNDMDDSAESMRKLTEMLLQNRPVVDPLKNQGFGIVTPHQHDILSGRGNGANQHPGNIFFRNLIHKYKHHYIHTGPSEKKLITKRIVEEVQQREPSGRFLKQNPETELWDCLDIDKVLKKTGQALREKAPELKKRAREEYKMKITTSQESYFQNSRAAMSMKRLDSKKSLSNGDYDSMSIRFDNVLPTNSTKDAMTFPIQSATLDAIAYQTIPLAGPSRNDAFNMSNLTAVANQVDPASRKKTEQLVALAADSKSSLADVYKFVNDNPSSLFVIKNKVVRNRYPLPVRRTSLQVQKVKEEEFIPNAVSPHPHDVLFHEGMIVASHAGSMYFCDEVTKLLPQYKGPVINEKRIEQKIIASIGTRWPPGRFLCAADNGKPNTTWHVLSFNQALQATSNHIRRACFEAQRILVPNPSDVLVVRGNSHHQGNHQGNIIFRNHIERYHSKYEHLPLQHTKKHIAKAIVDEIEKHGGRFLKFNSQQKFWEPLERETAMHKTLVGMRDYQKKKALQQKAAKPAGVVVPLLNCVKENVEDSGKNSDPPGIFFNYYSATQNINNNTLAIAAIGNDPPGQVATLANSIEVDTDSMIEIVKRPDSPGQDPNSTLFNNNMTPSRIVSVTNTNGVPPSAPVTYYPTSSSSSHVIRDSSDSSLMSNKRPHDMDAVGAELRPAEKRTKLEP